jgi:hypothetical protein
MTYMTEELHLKILEMAYVVVQDSVCKNALPGM